MLSETQLHRTYAGKCRPSRNRLCSHLLSNFGDRLLSSSPFVMIARELKVFSRFFSGRLGTTGQGTGTLLFGAPKDRGAVFCFSFLAPLVFLSPLFDASTSPRATGLGQVFCSHSLVSRSLAVCVAATRFARNVPVRLLA